MIHKTLNLRALGVALLLLALAGGVRADGDTLMMHGTITSGGGGLSAGDYALVSALGQPAAGALAGDAYRLTGGVIGAGPAPAEAGREQVYLPLLAR